MKAVKPVIIFSAILWLFAACNSNKELKSAAQGLNLDLDLAKSPYRYAIEEKEKRLILVLRRMPAGETAADATLRADIERTIAQEIGEPPRVVEVRIFEIQPTFRREVWLIEKGDQRLAFDVKMTASRGRVDFTVNGPVVIEGEYK
jgi:hypothetical protein